MRNKATHRLHIRPHDLSIYLELVLWLGRLSVDQTLV
jgi:hypothetical protein